MNQQYSIFFLQNTVFTSKASSVIIYIFFKNIYTTITTKKIGSVCPKMQASLYESFCLLYGILDNPGQACTVVDDKRHQVN